MWEHKQNKNKIKLTNQNKNLLSSDCAATATAIGTVVIVRCCCWHRWDKRVFVIATAGGVIVVTAGVVGAASTAATVVVITVVGAVNTTTTAAAARRHIFTWFRFTFGNWLQFWCVHKHCNGRELGTTFWPYKELFFHREDRHYFITPPLCQLWLDFWLLSFQTTLGGIFTLFFSHFTRAEHCDFVFSLFLLIFLMFQSIKRLFFLFLYKKQNSLAKHKLAYHNYSW